MEGINKLLKEYNKGVDIMLTQKEVMDKLHIKNTRTFHKLLGQGLPYIKIGRSYLVPQSKFIKWIDTHTIQ